MPFPSNPPSGPGIKSLRKIQLGLETTNGTAVNATKILRVPGGVLSDDRQVNMTDEMVGIIPGTDRSYISAAQGSISVDSSPLTPQQFPILLAAALGLDSFAGRTTPTQGRVEGTGTAYRYLTTLPTTTAPADNVSYTIEGGDSFEVERMTYAKCTNLSVSGSSGAPITMQGSFMGQYVRYFGSSFSTPLPIDTVEDLIFARSRLYLEDPASLATLATATWTAPDSTFLGFDISIDCSWVPKFTGQGVSSTVPTWEFAVFTRYGISGSLTLEHNSFTSGTANGLKQAWRNQTTIMLRIDCFGSQGPYTTTGSTISTPTIAPFQAALPLVLAQPTYAGVRFEFPVKINQISPLADNDGNDIVSVSWTQRYNSTYGSAGYILIESPLANPMA